MAKKDEAMIVVAKREGIYANTTQPVGKRFGITKRAHFSTRWMLDPNSKADADEAKILERQYNANMARSQADVSDDQILQELARASGRNMASEAEIERLRKRVAELETLLSQKDDGKQEPVEPDPVEEVNNDEPENEPVAAEDAPAAKAEKPVTRRTRRTEEK